MKKSHVIKVTTGTLQTMIDNYLCMLKTNRYKEDATFNVDEYYADIQKIIEDLRSLKRYIDMAKSKGDDE